MRLAPRRQTMFRSVASCVVLITVVAIRADASDPVSNSLATELEREEIKVVMRLSTELFEDLTQDVVEMATPIDSQVEGMQVRGKASGRGLTNIQLQTSDEHADFVITIDGTAIGSLRSNVGPATVGLTSHAQFSTAKRVRFDGVTFRDGPASTVARNCTKLDCIRAKRRGPIARIIERVGQRMANQAMPEINAAAEDASRTMLSQKLDETAAELIWELNQVTHFEELVAKYFPETKSWNYHMAARPQFILAGPGPDSASFPTFLIDDNDKPKAHVEFWMQLTPGQAMMLNLVADVDVYYDVLRALLPDEEAKQLAEDVKLERVGDWSVIRAGLTKF